jgi:cell division septum initiation protein DivIVA
MVTKSIPKLLQEANEVKQALEKLSEGVPAGISASEMGDRIAALEDVINQLNALNAEKTRLVDSKADVAQRVSDYIVQVRATIKGILGADSYEYGMVGGTRLSERKRPKRKGSGTA